MEEQQVVNLSKELKLEEDEEEFRSCYEDVDELKEREDVIADLQANGNEKKEGEESVEESSDDVDLDEYSVKMYFKGVSVTGPGDSGLGLSGIGVVMKRSANIPPIQVQKKLHFYVEESVADYLALMDGLAEAAQSKIRRVFAFTDSEILYNQITREEQVENPLLMALRLRILEHASGLESFVLKFIASKELATALQLAQVAIGVVSSSAIGDQSVQTCSICCEERLSSMIVTIKCSHKFCSHCMRTYVDGKVQSSQISIRCPQPNCKYQISAAEYKSFLPIASYESLERAFTEARLLNLDKIFCPYPNCSVLLDPHDCFSSRASSSSQSDSYCVECPGCQRFICMDCGVPWHSSMTCEEYQDLPVEERDAGDITLHRLAQNRKWRRCQQCRRMIELAHGCYHMTCWCGHEFCYSCGAEYRNGQQTCQCAFWNDDYLEDVEVDPVQQFEQWAWDSFQSLPLTDAYSDQERSQLALIHGFLSGSIGLFDQSPYESPPRCTDSYVDAMKDLNQLPWLERFVSVISDNYYEDYIQ